MVQRRNKIALLLAAVCLSFGYGCTQDQGSRGGYEVAESATMTDAEVKALTSEFAETRAALRESTALIKSGAEVDPAQLAALLELVSQAESRLETIAARLDQLDPNEK